VKKATEKTAEKRPVGKFVSVVDGEVMEIGNCKERKREGGVRK
jgi:hypothetical protein